MVSRRTATFGALLLAACGSDPPPTTGALSRGAVIASLEKSGLPVTSVVSLTAAADPEKLLGRPGGYIAKFIWRDTRVLDRPQRGEAALEVFAAPEFMRRRADELNHAAAADPALRQYLFYSLERRAIMRLPIDLTSEQANAYRAWLEAL